MQFTSSKNHVSQGIQILQGKTLVGKTIVGPPCIRLTAIYSAFDRVTADTDTCMTTTVKHCIAATGLNVDRL